MSVTDGSSNQLVQAQKMSIKVKPWGLENYIVLQSVAISSKSVNCYPLDPKPFIFFNLCLPQIFRFDCTSQSESFIAWCQHCQQQLSLLPVLSRRLSLPSHSSHLPRSSPWPLRDILLRRPPHFPQLNACAVSSNPAATAVTHRSSPLGVLCVLTSSSEPRFLLRSHQNTQVSGASFPLWNDWVLEDPWTNHPSLKTQP